jgi:hypothetical protein
MNSAGNDEDMGDARIVADARVRRGVLLRLVSAGWILGIGPVVQRHHLRVHLDHPLSPAEMAMKVQCDNTECGRMFVLKNPEQIVVAITTDEDGDEMEWIEREYLFCCPVCIKRYAFDGEIETE